MQMPHKDKTVPSIGIVGYGSFGKLLAQLIASHTRVVVHSRRKIDPNESSRNVRMGSLQDVAACDVIILCNELSMLEQNCKQLKDLVKPETIVMDVCSVKVLPAQILKDQLAGHCRVLSTHPMFGPMSVENNSARGKRIVWYEITPGPYEQLENFITTNLGLKVLRMTPDDHDKQMAWVHCLTFFLGRALLHLDPPQSELSTSYYDRLLRLVDIERNHSYELFRTIELGNSYAPAMRKQLLDELHTLDKTLLEDNL